MTEINLGADYMGELSRLSELTRFAELTRFLYVLSIILTFQLHAKRVAGTAAVACRVNSLSRDRNCPHIPCNRFLPSWLGKAG